MAKNKEKTTLQTYKSWKAGKRTLQVSKFLVPTIPAVTITAVNWEEWFGKCSAGLPTGFATLLIALLMTLFAYYNKDELAKKNTSPMFYIAGVMAIWGVAFLLLANIMNTMGMMFLCTCIGIVGGGVCDQVEKSVVTPRVEEYKQLVEENCLDKKSYEKQQRKLKAQQERKAKAEAEASQKQATE